MRDEQGNKLMVTPSVLYGDETAVAAIDAGQDGVILIRADGYVFRNGRDSISWVWTILDCSYNIVGSEDGEGILTPVAREIRGSHAMRSLISFLLACAEAKSEESENYSLFDRDVREWAQSNSDALSMIHAELEEELS